MRDTICRLPGSRSREVANAGLGRNDGLVEFKRSCVPVFVQRGALAAPVLCLAGLGAAGGWRGPTAGSLVKL